MLKITLVIFSILFFNFFAFSLEIKTMAQESSPKFMADPSDPKKITGICIDIMRAIEKIDPEIKFVGDQEFVPFKRIEQDLEDGKIDVFFGMIKNAAREKIYYFVDIPLYPTRNMMAIRADDNINVKSFDEIKKLGKDGVILVASGTAHYTFLTNIPGLIVLEGAKTVKDNLKMLIAKRGRFVYSSDKNFAADLEDPEIKGKIKIMPTVFNEEYQYAAFSLKTPKPIIEKVEKALKILKDNGELNRIFKKYINID